MPAVYLALATNDCSNMYLLRPHIQNILKKLSAKIQLTFSDGMSGSSSLSINGNVGKIFIGDNSMYCNRKMNVALGQYYSLVVRFLDVGLGVSGDGKFYQSSDI